MAGATIPHPLSPSLSLSIQQQLLQGEVDRGRPPKAAGRIGRIEPNRLDFLPPHPLVSSSSPVLSCPPSIHPRPAPSFAPPSYIIYPELPPCCSRPIHPIHSIPSSAIQLSPFLLLLILLLFGCCGAGQSPGLAMGAGMVELGPGMVEVGAAEVVPPAKRRRVVALKNGAAAATAPGRRTRPARRPAAIQRLFQACRAVFRGPGTVPAPAEVALLRAMLDRMRPEDVGLSPDMPFFRNRDVAAQGTPPITHTTIYKSEKFSMVLFFLPPNAVIPLHNHPGMTVFNKLLIGSMHAKSYDWADPDDPTKESGASSPDDGQLRLAELIVDEVFTAPCDTSVLYPTAGGNMHRFRAVAPCAFLDILGPPYSIEEDRDCTYYTDIPYSHHPMTSNELISDEQEGRRLAWLKEVEMPKDLKMCSVRYGGPLISGR